MDAAVNTVRPSQANPLILFIVYRDNTAWSEHAIEHSWAGNMYGAIGRKNKKIIGYWYG